MTDKAKRILEIAASKCIKLGAVRYPDFGGQDFSAPKIKRTLLDNGYVCHERQHLSEWWGLCGYKEMKTHFHKKEDSPYIKS